MRNSSTEFLRLNFIWVTFFFQDAYVIIILILIIIYGCSVSQVHCMDLSQIPH